MAARLAKLVHYLQQRGLVKDYTALPQTLPTEEVAAYCGFDPTAQSLHLGHLVTLNALAACAVHGIRPIALIGGGTALIGDPSGKSALRPKLALDTVRSHSLSIQHQISSLFPRLLHETGLQTSLSLTFVNNEDIYKDMRLLDWLREVGYFFPIKPLLGKDMVQTRGDGLTYTEFSYQLLQAYDFAYLYRHFNCVLQIGGSDQWGNITTGTELIRKTHNFSAFGLTLPLITTADGEKFGKSLGNALYLDSNLTSPYSIFQYCYNLKDEEIPDFLRKLTFKSETEIQNLCNQPKETRKPQISLGFYLLSVLFSEKIAKNAEKLSNLLFSGRFNEISEEEIGLLKGSMKVNYLQSLDLKENILTLMVKTGICSSKSVCRTLISQQALQINGEIVKNSEFSMGNKAIAGRFYIVKSGKKRIELVEVRD